jgi:hypothetical protein
VQGSNPGTAKKKKKVHFLECVASWPAGRGSGCVWPLVPKKPCESRNSNPIVLVEKQVEGLDL